VEELVGQPMSVPIRFHVLFSFQNRRREDHTAATYGEGSTRLCVDAMLCLEVLADDERPRLVNPLIQELTLSSWCS
jgi:hypothetical protein